MTKQTRHDEQYVELAAAPEAVYRYLADFTSQLDWADHVVDVERPAAGFVVGASFTTAGRTPADHRRLRITALQPPMRIAWEAEGPRGVEQLEFLLLPASDGRTSLARRVTVDAGGRLRRLLGGGARIDRLAEANRACLDRIKTAMEAAVPLDAEPGGQRGL